ncbi:MAG TPA: glucose 1-dehydrogenase [Acidobacteriaceae bacterium]|jgi:NAD(P)-dependent dehydrogenase (short-subunit alcohol dehydrogenase family)|nr:glucose 1-dehydrogenase [Acidobacteriaceae bacterium]
MRETKINGATLGAAQERPGCGRFDLSGRTALVVGGTSGIGRAVALGLAAAGANVVATARRAAEVAVVANEIRALGRRSIEVCSDVMDRSTLEHLHAETIAAFGKVDILVNAAGVTERVPTLECPEDVWHTVLETNLTGTLRACQIVAPGMVRERWGRIINIASLATFVAFCEVAAYGASKTGVGALTKSLAVELARHGVCVNAIAPGFFPTALNEELLNQTPRGREALLRTSIGRFGHVEELAGAAVFLASESASFITGQVIAVDGGYLASGVNQ